MQRGYAEKGLGQLTRAISDFHTALKMGDASAGWDIGATYLFKCLDANTAKCYFLECMRVDSYKFELVSGDLAIAHYLLGEIEEAEQQFRASSPRGDNRFFLFLASLANGGYSLALFEIFFVRTGKRPDPLCSFYQGKTTLVATYTSLIRHYGLGWLTQPLFFLAEFYFVQKRFARASYLYRRVAAHSQMFPWGNHPFYVQFAKARLEQLRLGKQDEPLNSPVNAVYDKNVN